MVLDQGRRVGLELKYLVRRIDYERNGERFFLRTHSAHDVRRYDVCKDLARLERFIHAGLLDHGFVVVLSNDGAFWREGRPGTIDAAFRVHDGRVLQGTLAWTNAAGLGTTRGRTGELELTGVYPIRWTDHATVPGPHGVFRTLVLEVKGASGRDADPVSQG